jgi:hypothetical protein
MKKFTFSVLTLLSIGAFALGSTFSACSSSSNNSNPGAAGTQGQAGSAAGTTGQAGMDGSSSNDASYPVMAADGKCVSGAFVHDGKCSCQPDVPTVCKNGCTNVMTDDNNCGGCDHACGPEQTCNAGVCGATPTTLVPSASGCTKTVGKANLGISITISGSTLYFADAGHGAVKSVPVAGGNVTTISTTEKAPHAIVATGTTVLWINSVEGQPGDAGVVPITATIRKSVGGAAPTDLTMVTNTTGGINGLLLSADGATLYFSSDTNIKKIPVAGGTATDVAVEEHGGIPGAMALDGTKIVYPTDLNGDVDVITVSGTTVAKCGKNGDDGELDPDAQINCQRIARSQGGLFQGVIAARGDRAYWLNNTSVKANSTAPNAGQSNEDIAQSDVAAITALAISTDKAYFGDDGLIEVAPLMPTAGEVKGKHVARAQPTPTSIALDAMKVYWATGVSDAASANDCAIKNIAQ